MKINYITFYPTKAESGKTNDSEYIELMKNNLYPLLVEFGVENCPEKANPKNKWEIYVGCVGESFDERFAKAIGLAAFLETNPELGITARKTIGHEINKP